MKYHSTDKTVYYNVTAYFFFILFFVWAIVNAKARILISDPAFYLFNIINSSGFFVPGTRYTAVMSQILVVFGVKLNVPLKFLIPLYSVSFVLIRFLYFFVVNNLLKNKTAGFAIIAISVVGVAESYFRPTSETTIAMLNSVLLYACLYYIESLKKDKNRQLALKLAGTFVLVIFGYLTHPAALFSLLFVIIWYSISTKKLKTVFPYCAVAFTLGIFMYKAFLSDSSSHHESLYSNLILSPLQILAEIKEYYPYKFFNSRFDLLYEPLAFLFFSAIILGVIKKKWLSVAFFILYSVFFFVVTCASFKEGDSNMQMEKIFLPLVLFSAVVVASNLQELIKMNYALVLSLLIIVLSTIGYVKINKARSLYDGRIKYLEEITQAANKEPNRKLVIRREELDNPRIIFTWAMGIETMMISSMNKNMETLTVFAIQDAENIKEKMKQGNNFLAAPFYTSFNYQSLNKKYFRLPEQEYILWDWKPAYR